MIFAQDIDWQHFKPLQSAGKIPKDFTELSSQKYQTGRKEIDENARLRVRKTQDQFFLKSNFIIDEVLHSGRVVFGDPVSNYLNTIKDNLLAGNAGLRSKIRIYTYRSTTINAFTTNDGIVLITTGLIAQTENEAQLAFILSHEFQHYIHKHALNGYVETRQMAKGRGIYKNLDPNEIELKAFQYSKELERASDSLGLILFKKSNYSTDAAQRMFDVLLYSYLPFDETAFTREFFNDEHYKIPPEYFLDTVSAVTAVDDYDDARSTHPNIKSRRSAIIKEVNASDDQGRQLFIQPEQYFTEVQKLCRYENCILHLNNSNFEEAFDNAYLLQQSDEENIFLKKTMSRALYGAALYKNYGHSTDHDVYYKDVEGEAQQIYYLFDKMPKKEFTVLVLRYCWKAHLDDETDATLIAMCKDLATELVIKFDLTAEDFKDAADPPDTSVKKPARDILKTNAGKNKVDKIKTSEMSRNSDVAYWRYAYVNFRKDDNFNQLISGAGSEKKAGSGLPEPRSKNDRAYTLGIDRAVIVNPLYLKVDETRRDPIRYEAAEQLKLELQQKIQSCADALDMQIEYLDTKQLNDDEVDKFNNLAALNNWISEELDHDDVPVINSGNELMQHLEAKYNTGHFAWIGVISFHEQKQYVGGYIALSFLFPPLIPFAIARAFIPKYNTAIFTMVADGTSGNFEMQYSNVVDSRDLSSIQKSNIYYIMQQMKTKPEEK